MNKLEKSLIAYCITNLQPIRHLTDLLEYLQVGTSYPAFSQFHHLDNQETFTQYYVEVHDRLFGHLVDKSMMINMIAQTFLGGRLMTIDWIRNVYGNEILQEIINLNQLNITRGDICKLYNSYL